MASEPPMPVMMIARFDSYEGLQEQATATCGFLFSLQALAAEINQSTKIALSFYLFHWSVGLGKSKADSFIRSLSFVFSL